MDATVMIWDCNTGKSLCTLEGPKDSIETIAWHPKGNVIFAGSADGSGWMWGAQGALYMNTFIGHKGPITGPSSLSTYFKQKPTQKFEFCRYETIIDSFIDCLHLTRCFIHS
jgi:WD40 repeat protein